MSNAHIPRPTILLILDGWGLAPPGPGNAITLGTPHNLSQYWITSPHTQLTASGEAVGLPRGEPGNTETGHLNIGAGQIVYQDLLRINMAIADGSFFQNKTLETAIHHAQETDGDFHLMGLIGAGGVHSNIEHLFALLRFCHNQGFTRVYLHLFTDGRDSPPTGAPTYLSQIRKVIDSEGLGQIASVMGRYYAMDRDLRWDRTEKAYLALTRGQGLKYSTPEEAIQAQYAIGKTDEFIEPCVCTNAQGNPIAIIKSGDSVVFFNFRIDRPRQLTKAFTLDDFEHDANKTADYDPYLVKYTQKHEDDHVPSTPIFPRGEKLKNLRFTTLTEYQKNLPADVAFPPQSIDMPLARILSERGMRQLHAAESEKERFVTFFFNGQRDHTFPGEDRLIVPSPKVSTYDLKPEMSAFELTTAIVNHISTNTYDFIVANFANVDMVGHTGNLEAAIKAVDTVDHCVGIIVKAASSRGGCVLITADHGNAEEMINPKTGQTDTEHSTFPVPFIIVHPDHKIARTLPSGILADVAPTILHILQIPKPPSMFGRNLLI